MSKWTGPSAGAVHVYQTEPAGRPRRGVNRGSPGSGVASSRSRASTPSGPSIGAAAAKSSLGTPAGNPGRAPACRTQPDRHRRRPRVPGARAKEEARQARFPAVGNPQLDFPGLPNRDFAERDRRAQGNGGGLDGFLSRKCRDLGFRRIEFTRQIHRQSVLAGHLHGVDPHLVAAGRASGIPAVDVEPGSGGHVGVRAQGQGQFLFPIAFDGAAAGGDPQVGGGGPPDHRPGQRRPRRGGVDAVSRHLRPVEPGLRISEDDPLHVVHARRRNMLAAGDRAAIAVPVEPQVEIVQHGAADGVGGRLVPGQHQVESAGALRHQDVLKGVLALPRLGDRGAAAPTVGSIPVEHAGSGRNLAQSVPGMQCSRPAGVGCREGRGGLEPGVRPDGAGHQPGTGQRGLLTEGGDRIHQQGGHPGHRRRRETGAVGTDIATAAARALGRVDTDAGGDHLGRQASVEGRPVAAEGCNVPAVHGGADGQRVLCGGEVGKSIDPFVRLRDDIELALTPDDGIELALFDAPSLEFPGGITKAHVDDQGFDRKRRAGCVGALGRAGEKIHGSVDAVPESESEAVQDLGETDVAHRRRHAGKTGFEGAVPENGSGDVGSV